MADDPAAPADRADESADPPIERGRPTLENALFVLLGVAIALGVVLRLAQLFG